VRLLPQVVGSPDDECAVSVLSDRPFHIPRKGVM
jgi:hypothetical protein